MRHWLRRTVSSCPAWPGPPFTSTELLRRDSSSTASYPPTGSAPASFQTVDTTPPTVTALTATPQPGGTATIAWTTSKATNSRVDFGTSSTSLTSFVSDSGMVTSHALILSGLSAGTTYFYRVTSVDALNNSVTSPPTTGSPASFVENVISIFAPTATPAVADSSDPNSVEIGMRFRSDAAGLVTGVRFYKASTNTGAHLGHLWTNTGTLLGTVTFANETASGWQQANFATPVSITANTTYVVSYFDPAGHYSYTLGAFASAGVDNPPLHALANGVDGGNAVYTYSATGVFPTVSSSGNNYWVDVAFVDNVPPVITAVVATPAVTSATITWTTDSLSTSRVDYGVSATALNLNVSNATLATSHSITLSSLAGATTYFYRVTSVDSSGNSSTSPVTGNSPATFSTIDSTPPVISAVTAIPAGGGSATITWTTNKAANSRVDYGTSSGSLTLNVSDATLVTSHSLQLNGLTGGATYFYRVTSVDAGNNSATSPASPAAPATFVETASTGVSIWTAANTPSIVDSTDPGAVELGMRFRSDAGGVISAIRFYKAATNTGTHTGHLWSNTGTLLGTVTFTGETASGWQQANFTTAISITANTTYVVSYFAPSGHYSLNQPGLVSGVEPGAAARSGGRRGRGEWRLSLRFGERLSNRHLPVGELLCRCRVHG